MATVIGLAALLVGSTTVFAELQTDLDRIWKAPVKARLPGLGATAKSRAVIRYGRKHWLSHARIAGVECCLGGAQRMVGWLP